MFKISVSPLIQSAVNLHRVASGLCLCPELPFLATNVGHHTPTYPSCPSSASIYTFTFTCLLLHSHSRFENFVVESNIHEQNMFKSLADKCVCQCKSTYGVCVQGVGCGRTDTRVTKCLLHFAEIADGGILHAVCQAPVQTCINSNFLSVTFIRTIVFTL